MSLRWTRCVGLLTSRCRKALAFFGCRIPAVAGADSGTVHHCNARPTEFRRRGRLREDKYTATFVAYSDPEKVSWADSRFYTRSRQAGDALVPSLWRHVARQMKYFWETELAQRRFRGRVWWIAGGAGGDVAAAGGKVQAPGADGAGRGNADKGRGRDRGIGKKASGGGVPPPAK